MERPLPPGLVRVESVTFRRPVARGLAGVHSDGDTELADGIRFAGRQRTFIIVRDHEDNDLCADGLRAHEDGHRSDGLVMESTVDCPMRASIFDCSTEDAQMPPACGGLNAYPAKIENSRVPVEI